MIKIILWGLFTIYCVFLFAATIIFNIVHFVCRWKCRKKKYDCFLNRCNERECLFNCLCDKYEHIYSDEEIARLKQMLADYQARTEKDSE